MKNNNTVLRSRYGKTDVSEEFLRYPFESPIKYDVDYTGTYSKFSIVDKYYVDTLVKPHKRLISGGAEWGLLGASMTFSTSDVYYTFTGQVLSISASYPGLAFENGSSAARIDAVVINEDGSFGIVKGEPKVPPARPAISDSQILLQYAYIGTSSTTIGSTEQVYTNNAQWQVTNYQLSGLNSGTFNAAFGGDDYSSGFCVQLDTDYRTGVKFTKPAGGLLASDYGSISMRIKFTSVVPDHKSLFVQIQGTANGATVYGNTLNLMTYGLQREITNVWQHVVVQTSKFGPDFSQYNALTLRMAGGASGSNTLWRVDNILIQPGWVFDGYMGEPDATGGVGGGSTTNAVTGGVIGPAEDGTYTDGVFTDFNPLTPIGTAVDRFNELFLALVPAPAPALSNWSGSRSGGFAGNGKLSFGTTDQTIDGTTYFAANAGSGASPAVAADGAWTVSGKRLTIYPAGGSDITGTLANDVAAESLGAYGSTSFREATLGNLTLSVNGLIVSTQSLSNPAALDNTSGNTISGFVLSAATASKFQNGKPFETDNPLFTSRNNCTWRVKANDPRLRNGYNYIIAEHKSTSVNTFTRTLARFDFIQDSNTFGTTFSEFSITSFSLSGSKFLSGIEYFTGGTINYDGTMSNLYRNTYNPDADAVSFNDTSITGNGSTLPIVNLASVGNKPILNCGDDENKVVRLSTDYNSSSPLAFSLLTSSKRRLNDPIGISTTAKRTLQGTRTGGTVSITNVYLDNFANNSNLLDETFNSETYRLKGETAGLSYSIVADVTGNAWDSSQSLTTGDTNHSAGLMVYNGKLMYPTQATPTANFSTAGSAVTNPNFGNANRDYTAATGTRTYIRYFRQTSPSSAAFTLVITGTNTTFVAEGTALTGNNVRVHLKLPTGTGAGTGWLDCYSPWVQSTLTANNYSSGGLYWATAGATRALGGSWGLNLGSGRSTVNSNGYVVVRITVGSSWAGTIENMSLTWY